MKKIFTLTTILFSACLLHAQVFYVLETGTGAEKPIKTSLVASEQVITELPQKASYIIKTDVTTPTYWKRGTVKLVLINNVTGKIVYQTQERHAGPGSAQYPASLRRAVKRLMKNYGSDILLNAQKNIHETMVKDNAAIP
jgi:hypothetical protein